MKKRWATAIGVGLLVAVAQMAPASAAEIKILARRAIWTVLNEAGPAFERMTGHKLNVSVDLAAVVVQRVNAGERSTSPSLRPLRSTVWSRTASSLPTPAPI